MHWYIIYKTYDEHDILHRINVGTRKKDAIKAARKKAAEWKTSVTLTKVNVKTNETDFVGIAEFPNYLRDLKLEWNEIHFEPLDNPF